MLGGNRRKEFIERLRDVIHFYGPDERRMIFTV